MKLASESPDSRVQVPPEARYVRIILLAIICGAAIALAAFAAIFDGTKVNFEDAATLGVQTSSVFTRVGSHAIHCMDSRDAADCIAGAVERAAKTSVLWLGNSQLHAVNQLLPGETNAVPMLFDSLARHGLDLVTFSQPNASLQEHYVLFEYLRKQLPLRVLILPVVFDDFREEGLREEVAALARNESMALRLTDTEIGRRLLALSRSTSQDQETAGIAKTMQEKAERALNSWLNEHSPLWAARPTIRGEIFIGLYRLRNTLFGIKATSKRKMIPGRYKDNWAALQELLTVASRSGISVFVYVAPLRSDVEIPYDKTEYAQFKTDLEELASQHGATYSNLESLVPAKFWGRKDATGFGDGPELDFMHFQAGGHKILAARLDELVRDVLARRKVTR